MPNSILRVSLRKAQLEGLLNPFVHQLGNPEGRHSVGGIFCTALCWREMGDRTYPLGKFPQKCDLFLEANVGTTCCASWNHNYNVNSRLGVHNPWESEEAPKEFLITRSWVRHEGQWVCPEKNSSFQWLGKPRVMKINSHSCFNCRHIKSTWIHAKSLQSCLTLWPYGL